MRHSSVNMCVGSFQRLSRAALCAVATLGFACGGSKKATREAAAPVTPSSPTVTAVSSPAFVGYPVQCDGKSTDLAVLLPGIAQSLKGQKYVRGKTDCSNMFHKVRKRLEKVCKGYEAPSYLPSYLLAKQLYEQKQLVRVRKQKEAEDKLKPGAVVFFGNSGKDMSRAKTSELFVSGSGIVHVAVIVKVEREGDKVVAYHMFHGRSSGTKSDVTVHNVAQNVKKGRPMFGNHDQYLVAFAPMAQ